MAFSPSFGSVGDFLSIGILIKDVIVALDDCRGSSRKHQKLRQGLVLLEETINLVQRAFHNPELVVPDDISTSATGLISQICQSVTTFKSQKLEKYSASFSPGGSGNSFKDAARKIQFKFDEEDIEKFQGEIREYKELLIILLNLSVMHSIERKHEDTVKQISAIASENQQLRRENARNSRYLMILGKYVLASLGFLSHSVADIHKSITEVLPSLISISTGVAELRSKLMGIAWPPSDEHFVLEDASGRRFPIHLKTITSWHVFECILQERFKDRPGAHRVSRGRYMLNESATSTKIDRNATWENAFRPDQPVNMSIMCKGTAEELDAHDSAICPFCHSESTSGMDEQVKCPNCNMFCTRIIDLEDEDISIGVSLPPRDSRSRARDRRNKKHKAIKEADSESDEGDYRSFTRIALVSRRKRTEVAESVFAGLDADDYRRHVGGNRATSSDQDNSESKHNRRNSDSSDSSDNSSTSRTYYWGSPAVLDTDEDGNEYVDVNGITYLIPAKPRYQIGDFLYSASSSRGRQDVSPSSSESEYSSSESEYYTSEPQRPQISRPSVTRKAASKYTAPGSPAKEATEDAGLN